MHLNNLKPAWRRFKLLNSMRSMNQEEILLILERAEGTSIKTNRFMMHALMFIVVALCCQGG